jgi:hypothetical protein
MSISLLQFCQWLNDTGPATALRESTVMFPVVESVHTLAIALVVGTVAVVDLRLLGVVLKKEPVTRVAGQILPITWLGFGVMLMTGLMLFAAEATKCYYNPAFRLKLILLALVGLNPLIFHSTIYRSVARWDDAPRAPGRARLAAVLSLGLWSGVVIAGRAFAYYN